MNADEAKYILASTRRSNRKGDDPVVAEAMGIVHRDAMLASWLEQETAFDEAIAKKFAQHAPPVGLLDEILAGGKVSRPTDSAVRSTAPLWVFLAASVALFFSIFVLSGRAPAGLSADQLAAFVAHDLTTSIHDHTGASPQSLTLGQALSERTTPLADALGLTPEEMATAHCRDFDVVGNKVYEVCFARDGVFYHAYATIADREAARAARERAGPFLRQIDDIATASWVEGKTLVTIGTRGDLTQLEAVL